MTIRSITISPELIFREMAGEAIVLNCKTEHYFGLDEISMRIVKLLRESGSVETTFKTLLQEYDVKPSHLERDLHEFIEELIRNGLATAEGRDPERCQTPGS